MKIRRIQHDDYETDIVEEKKTEVAMSSSARYPHCFPLLSQTEREGEELDSSSNTSGHTTSNASSPATGSRRPGTASAGSIRSTAGRDDAPDDKASNRDIGPEAPTRPVRGRPPSKRAFHNFLAALRPLMTGATAAAIVARGADLWAAMDEKQRKPFRRAAQRARRMRTHRRRSGRSISSRPRTRRSSRRARNRARSSLSHHTISFVPRMLALPAPSFTPNMRGRALSVRSSPSRLPGNHSPRHLHRGQAPNHRRRRPQHPRSRRQMLVHIPQRSVAPAGGGMSGGGLILRAALRMSQQSRPPSSRRSVRAARSCHRRRTMNTISIARWQQCSRNRRLKQLLSPIRRRASQRRLARSRSRSGAERRSRSRVRRPQPHTQPRRRQVFTTFSIRQAPLTGSEHAQKLASANEELAANGPIAGTAAIGNSPPVVTLQGSQTKLVVY